MGLSRRPRSDALVCFLEQIALYFEQRLLSRFWFPIHLRPLAPVAGLSPCVGFLAGVLLSRDIVCFLPGLGLCGSGGGGPGGGRGLWDWLTLPSSSGVVTLSALMLFLVRNSLLSSPAVPKVVLRP